jgi:hypothetical protein
MQICDISHFTAGWVFHVDYYLVILGRNKSRAKKSPRKVCFLGDSLPWREAQIPPGDA